MSSLCNISIKINVPKILTSWNLDGSYHRQLVTEVCLLWHHCCSVAEFALASRSVHKLFQEGMTKYRKGQQRTTKDSKGPTKDPQRTAKEHYTGPQSWENCQTCNNFVYFFGNFVFLCFFVNFGVLMNYGGLWNDHFEIPAQTNQSFCFLFCAVGTWSTTTSQFLPSIWILDGAGRSGCHQ